MNKKFFKLLDNAIDVVKLVVSLLHINKKMIFFEVTVTEIYF